ncbi:uncharacterized protein LOC141710705 [Apium graveolens]|uniref:uncharacterized protein LOC141710705 n=1 Tax=Apium graveolens TaxID=4045 RepID=UPI003D7B490C
MTNRGEWDKFRSIDMDKEIRVIETLGGSSSKKKGRVDVDKMAVLAAWHRVNCHTREALRCSFFVELIDNYENDYHLDGDLDHVSKGMVYLNDKAALSSARTEIKDILYVVAEYYLSKHTTKWRKQSVLVPQFDRLEFNEERATINGSVKLEPLNVVQRIHQFVYQQNSFLHEGHLMPHQL